MHHYGKYAINKPKSELIVQNFQEYFQVTISNDPQLIIIKFEAIERLKKNYSLITARAYGKRPNKQSFSVTNDPSTTSNTLPSFIK